MANRIIFRTYDSEFLSFILGSKDGSILRSIEDVAVTESELYRYDSGTVSIIAEIAKRAIVEGCPFEELDTEEWEHVQAARWLVDMSRVPSGGVGTDWFLTPFQDAMQTLAEEPLADSSAPLVDAFIVGRPFFGKRFDEDRYGFLAADEVKGIAGRESAVLDWCNSRKAEPEVAVPYLEYTMEDVVHLVTRFTEMVRYVAGKKAALWAQFP